MPPAPSNYPDVLRGYIWMDQAGYYGASQVPSASPDLVLSFGDPLHPLDTTTRSIRVNTTGPCWSWANNARAYLHVATDRASNFTYKFMWDESFSSAVIYSCTSTNGHESCRLNHGNGLLQLKLLIIRQSPAKDMCPPAPRATKADRASCAKFVRVTRLLFPGTSWTIPFLQFNYYVFQIAGDDGTPVEPYFTAYVDFAKSQCQPAAASAQGYGINCEGECLKNSSAFIAVRPGQ